MSGVCRSLDDDRLSNLPLALKHIILNRLPIHDAARTCVLSKAWRETWTTQPCLALNMLFYVRVIRNKNQEAAQLSAFSAAVDKILSIHTDPISDFQMFIPPKLHSHHIHHWIHLLPKEDVRVLKLDNSQNYPCLPPSYLYDFANLKELGLFKWRLSPPPESRCFSNLVSVDLISVSIFAPVSFGTHLQVLKLHGCIGIEHLVFINFNNLKTLIIDFIQSKSVNLIRLLSNCTRINILVLNDFLLEILGPDPFTVKTHATKMVNLKTLDFCVLSFILLRISNCLCLIRNLPNLQKLRVTLDFKETRSNSVDSAIESYLEALDWEDVVLSKLQIVQIHGVIGVRSELQFSKILLASSPSLKEISVFCSRAITSFNEKMRIKQEFLQLPKKSQQAQLLWHDWLL
ncbi:hypothetical protein ACET3Z_025640 [Daucus carota]